MNLINASIVFFSLHPTVSMMSTHVSRVIIKKFKIIWSVIGLYTVNMMDSFVISKFPSYDLFHYIAMFKNAFTTYVNAHVPKLCYKSFSLLKIGPIRRDIVGFMTKPPTPMSLTYLTRGGGQYIYASFYPTYLSFSHITYHSEVDNNVKL